MVFAVRDARYSVVGCVDDDQWRTAPSTYLARRRLAFALAAEMCARGLDVHVEAGSATVTRDVDDDADRAACHAAMRAAWEEVQR